MSVSRPAYSGEAFPGFLSLSDYKYITNNRDIQSANITRIGDTICANYLLI